MLTDIFTAINYIFDIGNVCSKIICAFSWKFPLCRRLPWNASRNYRKLRNAGEYITSRKNEVGDCWAQLKFGENRHTTTTRLPKGDKPQINSAWHGLLVLMVQKTCSKVLWPQVTLTIWKLANIDRAVLFVPLYSHFSSEIFQVVQERKIRIGKFPLLCERWNFGKYVCNIDSFEKISNVKFYKKLKL